MISGRVSIDRAVYAVKVRSVMILRRCLNTSLSSFLVIYFPFCPYCR